MDSTTDAGRPRRFDYAVDIAPRMGGEAAQGGVLRPGRWPCGVLECWSNGALSAAWPRQVVAGCQSVTQVLLFCGRELQFPRASACGWVARELELPPTRQVDPHAWRWPVQHSNTPPLPVAIAHMGLCAASGFPPHSWYISQGLEKISRRFPSLGKRRRVNSNSWNFSGLRRGGELLLPVGAGLAEDPSGFADLRGGDVQRR